MPRAKEMGRGRLDIRDDPAFLDHLDRVAREMGLDLSSFVRLAMREKLERLGRMPPQGAAGPRRPGRPKGAKGKAQAGGKGSRRTPT